MATEGRLSIPRLRLGSLLAVLAFVVTGCGSGLAPSMPTWSTKVDPYVPVEGSSNAFDSYALIATRVEETVPQPLLNRVYFDPRYRDQAMEKVEGPMELLVAATKKKCEFKYTPVSMFSARPYQRGWRLLGRAMRWQIRQACVVGNFDRAIDLAIAANKFGFDITGGSATDASLGFEIADEARKSIAPYLDKLGAGQLQVLADGLENALSAKPPITSVIEHEHLRMLEGVQYVQDAFANDRFDELMKTMKEDVRDGVAALRDLKGESAKKRLAYFEGFAQEADAQTDWLKRVAVLPECRRQAEPGPKLAKDRKWKSFSQQFFTAVEPLLRIQDATIARTRLLIANCLVLKQVKATGNAPENLNALPKDLTLDPFTGRSFGYHASGPVFVVYSLGIDAVDNGGTTDETFTSPDLTLESK